MGVHPLDFPAWSALNGRHAGFALGGDSARRYDPTVNVFAGVAGRDAESFAALSALVAEHGDVAMLEADEPPLPPGLKFASIDLGVQMVEARPSEGPPPTLEAVPLTDADAAAMLALAHLTQPGPFFKRTHKLGDFFGVKVDGRLAAMAGERMKPQGYTEVSGVCVHPDFRGRGYAAGLTRIVAGRIRARGEVPFLHAYAHNKPAITLYEALGWELRREVLMMRLTKAA
ncbi:MAG TPA: GNAT family N-acetyltransferase [Caulobacteraceae bacterium]|nr:GNAT family N-acetyltransferase [Caulobacteraceae bacterium]